MAMQIGVDISKINSSLNELFRATVTRIRRCISVKRTACEKIREDNQEAREYGFKHLRKVIELQMQSYPRYRNNISPFAGKVASLKEQVNSLEPLDDSFIGRFRFNNAKKNLEGNIAIAEGKFESIREKMDKVSRIIEAQRELLKPNMSGDDEAKLRNLISIEENLSEEIISELNGCMEFVFRAVKNIGIIQTKFIRFIKRSRANRGANLIEESQIFCDKIEKHLSTFYAFKSLIQIFGVGVGFFAPVQEIRTAGFYIAGGAFGVDFIIDLMSGLPETRRRIKRFMNKVDEEEVKQRRLTAKILGDMQRTQSEIPTI